VEVGQVFVPVLEAEFLLARVDEVLEDGFGDGDGDAFGEEVPDYV